MVKQIRYSDVRDILVNRLLTANTTTATFDLSTNLTTRVKIITTRSLELVPPLHTEYPFIGVYPISKTERFDTISNNQSDRMVDPLTFYIDCVYDSGINSITTQNLLDMVRNVEVNLRIDLDLNSYNTSGFKIMWLNPISTDFNYSFGEDSPYNQSARIQVDMAGWLTET